MQNWVVYDPTNGFLLVSSSEGRFSQTLLYFLGTWFLIFFFSIIKLCTCFLLVISIPCFRSALAFLSYSIFISFRFSHFSFKAINVIFLFILYLDTCGWFFPLVLFTLWVTTSVMQPMYYGRPWDCHSNQTMFCWKSYTLELMLVM